MDYGYLINVPKEKCVNGLYTIYCPDAFAKDCREGNLQKIKMLEKKYVINIRYNNYWIFRSACCAGNIDVVKWLLETFPDIDVHACNDESLRMARMKGNHKLANLLIKTCSK